MEKEANEKKKKVEIELRKIQDKFGEKLAHLCRILFQDILEYDGLLYKVLTENFAKTKGLGEYIEAYITYYERFDMYKRKKVQQYVKEAFAGYVYELAKPYMEKIVLMDTEKTPEELLDTRGYILYECKTEKEIQAFKKYYRKDEELCTFKEKRLKTCHVFFAVKKDVDKIKREDFKSPEREDDYSLSVLGIQFTRGVANRVSIKSRYNHGVELPDSVYGNNLEKLVPGLTKAFEKKYKLNISTASNDFLPFEKGNDKKYYIMNAEIHQDNRALGIKNKKIVFCPENIIIENGKIIDTYAKNKERYIVFDYFILDLSEKKISTYNGIKDSFIDGLQNIKKIDISKDENGNKIITLWLEESKTATIVIDKRNTMISYKNDNLEEIGDSFLKKCIWIKNIDIPKVKKIGNSFLESSYLLTSLNAPELEIIGDYALEDSTIPELHLPKLKHVGDSFCCNDGNLKVIDCPELTHATPSFAFETLSLQIINLPKLEKNSLEPNENIRLVIENKQIRKYLEGKPTDEKKVGKKR